MEKGYDSKNKILGIHSFKLFSSTNKINSGNKTANINNVVVQRPKQESAAVVALRPKDETFN